MNCHWCDYTKDELTLKEYKHWYLVLAESQHLLGWSHAVLKRHTEQFEELNESELLELETVISDWKAFLEPFKPDWFNEAHFGNIDRHFHMQLMPRYEEKREYAGRTFTDAEYGKMPKHEWYPEKREFLIGLATYLKK